MNKKRFAWNSEQARKAQLASQEAQGPKIGFAKMDQKEVQALAREGGKRSAALRAERKRVSHGSL